jgi:hypothetical protein
MPTKIFYAQVFRLTPANATNSDSITIVGAHQDSMNYKNPFDAAPGADDDGSGTVTILEALRGQHLSLSLFLISCEFCVILYSVQASSQADTSPKRLSNSTGTPAKRAVFSVLKLLPLPTPLRTNLSRRCNNLI